MNKPMKPCLLEFLPDQDEKWLTALLAPAPDESESLRRGRQFFSQSDQYPVETRAGRSQGIRQALEVVNQRT